jgi:hypothetical protein
MASTAWRAAVSGKQRMAMSQALMAFARRRPSLRSAAASVNSVMSVRLRNRSNRSPEAFATRQPSVPICLT